VGVAAWLSGRFRLRGCLGDASEQGAFFGRAAAAAVQHLRRTGHAHAGRALRREFVGALLDGSGLRGFRGQSKC
jgi:hypothetical protein